LSKQAAVRRNDSFLGEKVRLAQSTPSDVAIKDSAVSRNLHCERPNAFDRAAIQALSSVLRV